MGETIERGGAWIYESENFISLYIFSYFFFGGGFCFAPVEMAVSLYRWDVLHLVGIGTNAQV